MKTNVLAVAALAASAVNASPYKRSSSSSHSFAGTSCYFVQGLSDSDQQAYLSALASGGVKTLRLWVAGQPGGGNCVKGSISVTGASDFETTIGQYNYETLDLLDQTMVYAQKVGIKVIISPHDGNDLGGANG